MSKYILSIIILFAFWNSTYSQKVLKTWYFISLKGGGLNSVFINFNFAEDENIRTYKFNPGYYLSAKAGVNFKSSISLAFEFLASQMQQSYDITAGNLQYHKNLKMQSLEKIILLRGCGTKGGYLEAGLRLISFLNVSETNSTNVSQTIIRDDFNNNCFGILGGFGGPIYFHKKYDFNFGIRVSYTIASILKDGIYPIHDDIYHIPYSSDATTNPLIVYLTLGFDWHFQWATETPKF